MTEKISNNTVSVDLNDIQEIISMLSKLDEKQKQIILASLRGAVLIADTNKKEA
jgi:hypothetical protein